MDEYGETRKRNGLVEWCLTLKDWTLTMHNREDRLSGTMTKKKKERRVND